jgi:hypothetical protein
MEGNRLRGLPPLPRAAQGAESSIEPGICLQTGQKLFLEKCIKLSRLPLLAVRLYVKIRLECAALRHVQDVYFKERFPVFTGEFSARNF